MHSFQDLGLDAALIERLGELGYRTPTAFQEEAVRVIARGTTAVGVASAGSGKTLAYALGIASRLDPGSQALQALVLRPTDELAAATAEAIHRLIAPQGGCVALVDAGRVGAPVVGQAAVASPSSALAALEHSAIKLDQLQLLVIDGASAIVELGGAEALETVTAQVPKEAQRVLLTSELTRTVEDWIERHARRARRLTSVPAEVERLAGAAAEYYAAPRREWLPVLMAALEAAAAKGNDRVSLFCRVPREVEELSDRLTVRGVQLAERGDESGVSIFCADETEAPRGALSISWGSPADVESLRRRVQNATRTLIFLEPDELPHLQRLANALDARLTATRARPSSDAAQSVEVTREQLRKAAATRDLEPYMLLLEPLLQEFTPVQIAAAAAALLRERAPTISKPALPAFTRLYFGVGRRDGTRPADLVGAITGEASVKGDQVGRIELRDTYSLVEVSSGLADRVIKSLATTTIRGRPANVRAYRE